MNAPQALAIARLLARSGAHEPVIARLAAEMLAAEIAAALPPLPPQAVLLLRRLALDLPPSALDRLPDMRLRRGVAGAARGAIADAAANAARPALGPVADAATAVLFGDESELLACLARDGIDGRLDGWWWRQWLGRGHPDWIGAWARRPAQIPAALRLLTRAGLAAPVLGALARAGWAVDARAGLAALDGRDAMNAPAAPAGAARPARDGDDAGRPVAVAPRGAGATADAGAPADDVCAPDDARSANDADGADAAVDAAVDTVAQAATRTDDASAATGATVRPPRRARLHDTAAPAIAPRAAPGADAALLHDRAGESTAAHDGAAAATVAAGRLRDLADDAAASAAPQHASAPDRIDAAAQSDPAAPPPHIAPQDARRARRSRAGVGTTATLARQTARLLAADGPRALPRAATAPGTAGAQTAGRGTAARAAPDAPLPASAAPQSAPLDAAPRCVITHHARLLFLVNLLLGDGLYPDFTRPRDPGFPLPLWRLLALIGLRLIGPALRDDPLWPLLDRLGADLPVRDERDLARDWPLPAARPARRSRPMRRFRPLQPSQPLRRLPAGTGGVRARAAAPRRHPHRRTPPAAALACWLEGYLASLRARLAPALGLRPGLVGRALVGPAERLWVSEAEIVAVMTLDAHPVEWRLAGLDRDPGPLPGAGRDLRFVFE